MSNVTKARPTAISYNLVVDYASGSAYCDTIPITSVTFAPEFVEKLCAALREQNYTDHSLRVVADIIEEHGRLFLDAMNKAIRL